MLLSVFDFCLMADFSSFFSSWVSGSRERNERKKRKVQSKTKSKKQNEREDKDTVHAAYTGAIGTRQKCRYKRRAGISGVPV